MKQQDPAEVDAKMGRRGCRGGRRLKEKRDSDPLVAEHQAATTDRPDSGIGSGIGSPEKDEKDIPQESALEERVLTHQLQYDWSFWINDSAKDWKKALTHVCDIGTIQEFWSLFNHLCGPSDSPRFNFNLFKKGIRPEWEDEANGKAGRWNITTLLPDSEICDLVWEQLCLLVVGGKALGGLSAHVNGVYLGRKTNCIRASVWTNTKNKREVLGIGRKIQETLIRNLDQHFTLEFVLHKAQQGSRKILYKID